jgi:hypothetical protein
MDQKEFSLLIDEINDEAIREYGCFAHYGSQFRLGADIVGRNLWEKGIELRSKQSREVIKAYCLGYLMGERDTPLNKDVLEKLRKV